MRRFILPLICGFLVATSVAMAGTFQLVDGSKVNGKPESILDKGVTFQLENGEVSTRYSWDRFTADSLKELAVEAQTDAQREILRPMIENLPQPTPKPKDIVVKPVETPPRPKETSGIFGLFGSSLGWLLLIALYGANLFAAYEVHIYRLRPIGLVMGLAAIPVFGVLSPIIFGAMPTNYPPPEQILVPPSVDELAAMEQNRLAHEAEVKVAEAAAAAAAAVEAKNKPPEPVTYKRGDFVFNRRFIEAKFAGFFRVVPSEEEKDLVLVFSTSRGKLIGRRISKITQSELYLLVGLTAATNEEMIPFVEISEIQIRHKDLL